MIRGPVKAVIREWVIWARWCFRESGGPVRGHLVGNLSYKFKTLECFPHGEQVGPHFLAIYLLILSLHSLKNDVASCFLGLGIL